MVKVLLYGSYWTKNFPPLHFSNKQVPARVRFSFDGSLVLSFEAITEERTFYDYLKEGGFEKWCLF